MKRDEICFISVIYLFLLFMLKKIIKKLCLYVVLPHIYFLLVTSFFYFDPFSIGLDIFNRSKLINMTEEIEEIKKLLKEQDNKLEKEKEQDNEILNNNKLEKEKENLENKSSYEISDYCLIAFAVCCYAFGIYNIFIIMSSSSGDSSSYNSRDKIIGGKLVKKYIKFKSVLPSIKEEDD